MELINERQKSKINNANIDRETLLDKVNKTKEIYLIKMTHNIVKNEI